MNLDENAAAFGLFQLTFTNLTQQFAAALFHIRRIKEPDLKFEEIFKLRLSEVREALKKELKQFEGQSSFDMEVRDLLNVCAKTGSLAAWRNVRAHARVQIDANGITIFDWRTLKQLTINRDECVEKIQEAIGLTVLLDFNVGSLLRNIESDQKTREMLEEIFKTVEDQVG